MCHCRAPVPVVVDAKIQPALSIRCSINYPITYWNSPSEDEPSDRLCKRSSPPFVSFVGEQLSYVAQFQPQVSVNHGLLTSLRFSAPNEDKSVVIEKRHRLYTLLSGYPYRLTDI
jgi:hypothetical protein